MHHMVLSLIFKEHKNETIRNEENSDSKYENHDNRKINGKERYIKERRERHASESTFQTRTIDVLRCVTASCVVTATDTIRS